MARIVHFSSAHPRFDTRIFHKECRSLKDAGFDVHLVVADGLGDAVVNEINIWDVGKPVGGRLKRMTSTVWRIYRKVLNLKPDLAHFHDPELLGVGWRLQKKLGNVIYDAHENTRQQILSKPYLTPFWAQKISQVFARFERFCTRRFSGVITATDPIREVHQTQNPRSVTVANFPIPDELAHPDATPQGFAVYIGGITQVRGIETLVEAAHLAKVPLKIAGPFQDKAFQKVLEAKPEWKNVEYMGILDRESVRNLLAQASVGVVTLWPISNYIDSQPIKMFEYMSAKLPVIASDFPLWEQMIQNNNCGLCVDPKSPQAVAHALQELIADPKRSQEMGANGRALVEKHYQWQNEAQKMIKLYQDVLYV